MATVNIGGVQDEHYRYKMPKLQAKIEGRGNGIRTNIVNNVDIAKSLARPPLYLLKHFGVELGAQTRFEENTGNSIVNGAHDDKKLVEVLNQFIKAYVQCGECNNPETTMHVKKEIITLKCKACGAKTEVDMRHKLNSYIIKNPPPKEKKIGKSDKALKETKEAAKDSKDKKKKKSKKSSSHGDDENEGKENGNAGEGSSKELPVASKEEHEHEEDDEDEEENDNAVWMTDTSAAAVRARAQEQLSDATRDMVSIGNLEAEAEARRRKEAKAKEEERKKKEEESIPEDADNDAEEDEDAEEEEEEDEDEEQEIIDKLRGLIPVKPAAAIVKALNNLEVEGGLVQKMRLLYEAVFGEVGSGQMAAVMSKRSELFTMFGAGTKGQAAQMVVFEYFVGVAHSAKISETPHVLKVMYDNDIVEEEVMKQWYENPSIGFKLMKVPPAVGKAVRDAASIVIEQLLDDDEEEEEEEEEEE